TPRRRRRGHARRHGRAHLRAARAPPPAHRHARDAQPRHLGHGRRRRPHAAHPHLRAAPHAGIGARHGPRRYRARTRLPPAPAASMKRASLARRIFRIIFAIRAINVFVTMVAIEFIYEDVADTIPSLEMAEERAFIERRSAEPAPQTWHTALLSALYVPDGATDVELPHLFRNRPVPFSAEVMDGEKSYLISIDRTASPPGVLYMAQDISILEDREDFM